MNSSDRPPSDAQPQATVPQSGRTSSAPGASRVDVTIPADPARLALLRGIAGAMAISLDFDLDTMADLRMAVDELGATVITRALPGSPVQVELVADGDSVFVQATARSAHDGALDTAAFGWMVLTTLADEVRGSVEPVQEGHGGSSYPGEFAVRASLRVRVPRAAQ